MTAEIIQLPVPPAPAPSDSELFEQAQVLILEGRKLFDCAVKAVSGVAGAYEALAFAEARIATLEHELSEVRKDIQR
jgi:hypothetical protein